MPKPTRLDVREDIRNGREPFTRIMAVVALLHPDDSLLLLAPFEPKPLFGVLQKHGFCHSSRQIENGDWEVLFTRKSETPAATNGKNIPAATATIMVTAPELVEVDVRGLEPPQPMVKILETLIALPDGVELRAYTDRRPMHLYPQLEARGFKGQTEEQSDGSYITIIRRN